MLLLIAIYTSELRPWLPYDTPLTKQKLLILLTQVMNESSAVDLPAHTMNAEILASFLPKVLASKGETY